MGKTLQIIALILTNRPPNCGPTLIVCPASVVIQWGKEIEEKTTKAAQLDVLLYHGSNRKKDLNYIQRHGVVVTTYALMAGESSVVSMRKKRTQGPVKGKRAPGPLEKIRWYRVVLDECHVMKNRMGQNFKAACCLNAEKRWCLSGTPIQNDPKDSFPYFRFLDYIHLREWARFKIMLKKLNVGTKMGYQVLSRHLVAITLRRDKSKYVVPPLQTLVRLTV